MNKNKVVFSDYYVPKPKQAEAHANRSKYLLFGGAMGGGKTFYLSAENIKHCMMFEGARTVLVRKYRPILKQTTMTTFFKICPPQIISRWKESELTVYFKNGSTTIFKEADRSKDKELDKLKGLEISWFGLDEANELDEGVFNILQARLRWTLPNGKTPRYEGRLTSNPAACWLVPRFIKKSDSNLSDYNFIQSLTTDNYDENSEYVKQLKSAFANDPELLKRYLYGDWNIADAYNQLISSEMITLCGIETFFAGRNGLGCDIARYGDDKTVLIAIVNGNIKETKIISKQSTTNTANDIRTLAKKYNIQPFQIGVDGIGVGAGVVDILNSEFGGGKWGSVLDIIGGATPYDLPHFGGEFLKAKNVRTQAYLLLKTAIQNRQIGGIADNELIEELSAIRYKIEDKVISIMPKDAIKTLLGRSPDKADALAYANLVATVGLVMGSGSVPFLAIKNKK